MSFLSSKEIKTKWNMERDVHVPANKTGKIANEIRWQYTGIMGNKYDQVSPNKGDYRRHGDTSRLLL